MYIFEGKCPHCSSDKGFNAFGVSHMETFDPEKSDIAPVLKNKWEKDYKNNPLAWYSIGGNCLKCKKPVVAYILAGSEERKKIYESIKKEEINYSMEILRIERIRIYPEPEAIYSHESIPDFVRRRFKSAQAMLRTPDVEAPEILAACRNTIEQAVNHIGNLSSKESLKAKIGKLHKQGLISNAIYNWAEAIKDF